MYTIAATIRKRNIASAATTARTKRLATPIFRKVPASSVMVNRSPGRTATKHRTGVWKPLFRRIIGLCPIRESTDRGCRSQKVYARKGLISPLHGVLGKAAHLGIRILQKLPHNNLWRAAVRRKGGTNRRIGATRQEFRDLGDVALTVALYASGYVPVYPAPIALNDLGKGRCAELAALCIHECLDHLWTRVGCQDCNGFLQDDSLLSYGASHPGYIRLRQLVNKSANDSSSSGRLLTSDSSASHPSCISRSSTINLICIALCSFSLNGCTHWG